MRTFLISIFVLILSGTLVSAQEAPVVDTIEISPADTTVVVGEDVQFTAVVLDSENAEIDTAVVWSAEGDIGTIDENGLFSATTAGSGIVIATVGDIADTAAVTVTEEAVPVIASIEIFTYTSNIAVGDSAQFHAEVEDSEGEDIDAEVNWSLSDSTVGSIDRYGLFIALAVGETKVIASAGEISGEAEITVKEEIILEPGVNTVNVLRRKADGKITKFGSKIAEGDTLTIGGIPFPLNFMNGTKIHFPENSLKEDITLTFKLPEFGKIQSNTVVFPDTILTAVTF